MKTIGIVLVLIGLILTFFTTFKFFTREKVVDMGHLQITTDKPHGVNWSPIVGIAVMEIVGAFLWQASKKQSL